MGTSSRKIGIWVSFNAVVVDLNAARLAALFMLLCQ